MRLRFVVAVAVCGLAACLQAAVANGTESLNGLCQRLKNSASFVERLHAAEALAEYGGRAVPALRGLLQYPDSGVREFAAVALSRMGPEAEPAVPELIGLLAMPADPSVSTVLATLARIGPAAAPAVPAIARLLPDSDWRVREDAIEALASIGTADAALALATQLERDLPDQKLETIMAIRECGPAAGAILSELVEFGSKTSDAGLRDEVFLSVARLGEPALDELVLLLDADPAVLRRCAAMAIGQMGLAGRAAVPELQVALRDPDAAVRFWAARALGAVAPADPRVQFVLWQALSDPDADVCWAAAESLGLNTMARAGGTTKGAAE